MSSGSHLDAALAPALEKRRQQHLYRQRPVIGSAQGAELVVDGQSMLAFSSNDYLGLAGDKRIRNAMQQAANHYGTGSGAAHLICGHSAEHHALEEELAAFTGRARALLFSTGYMANMGTIAALTDRHDTVLQDYLNHASLLDGGMLTRATMVRYQHNDPVNLEQKLVAVERGNKLVVTDGVFSMDGTVAKLSEMAEVCERHTAWLMVDDAHGLGVLGKTGAGCTEKFGLDQNQLPILMGTLGKGFGTAGAFVAGSENLIESLIQFARPYIYTTAMPPAIAAATRESLRIVQRENWRRDKLQTLIARFRAGATQLGLQLVPSTTPIQPVLINDDASVLAVGAALREAGILVGVIRPPTVPVGSARLRITLTANHSEQQVDHLLTALESALHSASDSSTLEPLK